MPAWYVEGSALEVLGAIAEHAPGSIDALVTSPPYLALRNYLPEDHPRKAEEYGTEADPAAYIAGQLGWMDVAWDALADHATLFANYGDTAGGSGGAGGDYNEGGQREGQPTWSAKRANVPKVREGTERWDRPGSGQVRTRRTLPGWPRDKSVCWIPDLIGASMAYGANLLDPDQDCRQWITRPPITWCSPNPTPGEIRDKWREATERIIFATKQGRYFFDLHALRHQPKRGRPHEQMSSGGYTGHPDERDDQSRPDRIANEAGAPPLNWWVISNPGFPGSHYATFPTELVYQPIVGGCAWRVCRECGTPRERLTRTSEEYEQARGQGGDFLRDRSGADETGNRPRSNESGFSADSLHLGWSECGCGQGCRPTVTRMENRKRVIDDPGECNDDSHWRPGRVLDPFGGTGTVGAVACANGRDAVLVDLDGRNLEHASQRLGMDLVVVTVDELVEILGA